MKPTRLHLWLQASLRNMGRMFLVPPPEIRNNDVFWRDVQHQSLMGCAQAIRTSIAFIVVKQLLAGSHQLIAFIQAGVMAGLLGSLVYTRLLQQVTPAWAYVGPHLLGWLAIALSALVSDPTYFAGFIFLASCALSISTPMQGVIYSEIYPDDQRGRLVGLVKQWQMLASVMVAWGLGYLLEHHPGAFRYGFAGLAVLGCITSLRFGRIKTEPRPPAPESRQPLWQSFRCLWDDPNFGRFMILQFALGLSNLAGVTVIQVYLNDPEFLGASPQATALITGVLPPLLMFLSVRFWGRIFDKITIVTYRAVTSLTMALGFFLYPIAGISGAFAGAMAWGTGRGGGQLAWSIGVLAFTDRQRSAEYLSVHTFLTGVRGVMAPFIGVWALASGLSPQSLFWLIGVLISLTAVLTLFLVKDPQAPVIRPPETPS
jgi:hypothetical protein